MHRFIAEIPSESGEITLSTEQSHHLARVVRVTAGETIGLIDGKGTFALAVVLNPHPKHAVVSVQEVTRSSKRSSIRLCFAIPKGPALDSIFRRVTELGVQSFQPLTTRFSSSSKGWKASRWEQLAAETCKQCEGLFFPEILHPQDLEEWTTHREKNRFLVLCDENARDQQLPNVKQGAFDLVIGAEGGFAKEEVDLLLSAGAHLMGLGKNRLRADTANVVATALLKKQIGEI